ncbi:hypothetical protein [Acetivibrio cellulolyticus]|uniref:hypothetical protein n=1 Tax=Acetivibrio cellulolyticus TaxID=35830 RepID=UPI0001E2C783|nr:hypothetical protein [Acetivibrio cellulolyticus]
MKHLFFAGQFLKCKFSRVMKNNKGTGILEFVLLALVLAVLIFAIGKLFGAQIMELVNKIIGTMDDSGSESWGS